MFDNKKVKKEPHLGPMRKLRLGPFRFWARHQVCEVWPEHPAQHESWWCGATAWGHELEFTYTRTTYPTKN